MKLSPHQRIMKAAKAGKGLRLSAEEVQRLAADDAIARVASGDDEDLGPHPEGCDCFTCCTHTKAT